MRIKKDRWHSEWRRVAAYTYILICIVDFILMPVYYEYSNMKLEPARMVELATKLDDSAAQVTALTVLRQQRTWEPITSEVFHLSFGAILGVAAWTGGARRRKRPEDEPHDNGENE